MRKDGVLVRGPEASEGVEFTCGGRPPDICCGCPVARVPASTAAAAAKATRKTVHAMRSCGVHALVWSTDHNAGSIPLVIPLRSATGVRRRRDCRDWLPVARPVADGLPVGVQPGSGLEGRPSSCGDRLDLILGTYPCGRLEGRREKCQKTPKNAAPPNPAR
jgi:hypothetical protein